MKLLAVIFLLGTSPMAMAFVNLENCSGDRLTTLENCVNDNFTAIARGVDHVELDFRLCTALDNLNLPDFANCVNDNFSEVKKAFPRLNLPRCHATTTMSPGLINCINDNFVKVQYQF